MEESISIENLKQHIGNIHYDRNPYDHPVQLEQAGQYIKEEFLKTGMEVEEDGFEWKDGIYKNIVAKKRGTTSPETVLILGAHYDTARGSPGADDNASAIAVLLEVARSIQPLSLASTVKLIAFSLEEVDDGGSTHYAEKAKREGEKILGMISLETVGFTGPDQRYPSFFNPKYYPNVGDFIGVIGNEKSAVLLEEVKKFFKKYVPGLPAEFFIVPGNGEKTAEARLSDHTPFWDRGFPALLVTDTAFMRNPHYHRPSDTMETLNFDFMKKVATGIFFSIAEMAGWIQCEEEPAATPFFLNRGL